MKIKYEYKGKNYKFQSKSVEKIEPAFKISLQRKLGLKINQYLSYLGFDIESCRLCEIGNVPIWIKFEIIDSFIKINDFSYKRKVYCYGENKNCPGIDMNPNSFEFLAKVNNISIKDAKILLKENNKSPFYRENHDSEESYKKSQSRNLESYIEKYGEELGKQKYLEHVNNIKISNSLDRYIEKYGKEFGEELFKNISKKKDSMSLDYFIKKNNGNLEDAMNEFKIRKVSVNISVNNLIKKYGEELGLKKHKDRVERYNNTINSNPNRQEIYKSRGITIDNLLNKYKSIDIAIEKYDSWRQRVLVPICKASKESLSIFNPLSDFIIDNYDIELDDIFIGTETKKEYFIKSGKDIFFYDFTIKSRKIIIEYNGILFHPKNEKSDWKNPFNPEITSETAFNKQKNKIKIAEQNGFKVLEIWSDGNNNLDKCIEFIKNNI